MNNRYYLATTGISEIWDINSNLLLLGPWCLTSKENRKLLKNKSYEIISSPFKPATKIKEAADYCYKFYEELLPRLSESLNAIHHVSYPVQYWRVLIGPWLLYFIEVFYDRYRRIEKAFDLFPDLLTNVLSEEQCKLATYDTYDFLAINVNEDYYNFKLFSLVAQDICPESIIKTETVTKTKVFQNTPSQSWKNKLFHNIFTKHLLSKGTVLLADMYHLKPFDMFSLKLKAGFNTIGFLDYISAGQKNKKIHYSSALRQQIIIKSNSNRFQTFLCKIIPDAIPMCYIEKYKFYRDSIKSLKNIDPAKIVGSAVGWYSNEEFKLFAAEAVSKGAKLIDFQHGGGNGLSLAVPSETISLEKNIFYTWGWNSKNNNKLKPLPSPHLSRIKDTHSYRLNNILFVGMTMPRYHYKFHTCLLPDDMPNYFEYKKIFFQTLPDKIKNRVLYRPYSHEYGWGEKEYIRKICRNASFISKGILVNWMKKVKLVVIDHPHTSYIEALTINVPCVFYWDHDVYLMRPDAEQYFELLRKAGIVYKDPQSAAKKVNDIFNNPVKWWLSDEVQKARFKFCERYGYARKDWLRIFKEEIKRISKQNIKNGLT